MARKILLADDSVTAQNMGRRILTDAGYEVVTVNNGSAALKKIAELKPELVVLDVYMPGYSGLEVCQRIKAAPETAAIPILLTVGKLEPFKAEEAKKVFADAFIVKPFEATELLGILSKLEDKIVPVPAARATKAAPAPPAKAAATSKPEVSAEAEANWKGRLRIEKPEAAKVEPAKPAAAFHEIRHDVATVAESEQDAIARNLPGNVTSDELAAITAAVAAFTSRTEEDFESGELKVVEPPDEVAAREAEQERARRQWEEAVAAHEAAFAGMEPPPPVTAPAEEVVEQEIQAPEIQAEEIQAEEIQTEEIQAQEVQAETIEIEATNAEQVAVEEASTPETLEAEEVSALAEPALADEIAESFENAADEPVPQVHESPELMAIEQEVSSAVEEPGEGLTEFEVNAALASLAPLDAAQDIMAQLQAAELVHDHTADHLIDAPPAAWAEQNAELGTAKWIAQEVGLEQSEAAIILEEEMQKVYSALGSKAPATLAEGLQSWEKTFARVEEAESASTDSLPDFAATAASIDASIAAEEAAAEGSYQSYGMVPEPVAVEAVEVEPVGENHQPEISAQQPVSQAPEAAAAEEVSPTAVEAIAHDIVATKPAEAFAAAAAASAGAPASAPASEPTTQPAEPETVKAAEDAELAAAWTRWRQIRESVSSPQFVEQVADVATAEIQDAQSTPETSDASQAASANQSETTDPAAIASIVDSVLADLKPRLVAEIARKLSQKK